MLNNNYKEKSERASFGIIYIIKDVWSGDCYEGSYRILSPDDFEKFSNRIVEKDLILTSLILVKVQMAV